MEEAMTTSRVTISIVVLLGACCGRAHAQGAPAPDPFWPRPLELNSSPAPAGSWTLGGQAMPPSAPSPGGDSLLGLPSLDPQGGHHLDESYREGVSLCGSPAAVRPETLVPATACRPCASTWYTRQEYFHWNERFQSVDLVNETGLLMTLGYQRRSGVERFRGELFGGTM